MESLSLTATNLVLWAFPSAAEVAVGELTESQRVKISRLRQRINDKLKENPKARSALFDVENNSKFDLEKVAVYLQVAMYEDTEFAAEMKAICQELGTLPDDKGESQQKLIRKIRNQMIVGASGGALIGNIL